MKKHFYGSVNIRGDCFSLCGVRIGLVNHWVKPNETATCKNCRRMMKPKKKRKSELKLKGAI